MPEQVKPTMMFLILDYVMMKMRSDTERKVLVIDEAWSLLQRTQEESYIFRIVKTCRKFNLGLLLITQDVQDIVRSSAGKALLNNSEYTLLLRQKPAIIDDIVETFQLSFEEREKLLTAAIGEGILIVANEHSEIKIIASPEEHAYMTTNIVEISARPIVTEFEENKLDYAKGFYRKKDLTSEQVHELMQQGYVISSHIGVYGGRQEEYVLRPRRNESLRHFFAVKVIEEYARKYSPHVEIHETKDADIVVHCRGQKIAIEIETGTNKRNDLLLKVKQLNRKYNDWFFVVTDEKDREKYAALGRTIGMNEVREVLRHYLMRKTP